MDILEEALGEVMDGCGESPGSRGWREKQGLQGGDGEYPFDEELAFARESITKAIKRRRKS